MNANQWPRVKELFHGALDRPPADRSVFLEAACGPDAALRAEVERLLTAHGEVGGFIEQGPAGRPGLSGKTIGRYQVGPLIGAGGMGEVYAARDLELGRTVAIKFGRATDPDAQTRLRREAQHASQLNHPHICTIHEAGLFDGQPFIVMEYVDGRQLSDLIPAGGLPTADVLRYGAQVADGLAHAHRHGVTHRDLKSANVSITREGRAKILDFGLASGLSPENLNEISRSRATIAEGEMAGTLSSMAPELLRGESANAGSDIWALGVLLYEMAAGRPPFSGATGFELTGAILHAAPPPLSDHTPRDLQAIVVRCLEKDPGERFQSVDDVRDALDNVRADHGTTARPAVGSASLLSGLWRHRLTWAAAIAVALVAGPALWRAARAPQSQAMGGAVGVGPSGRPAIAVMHFENVAGTEDVAWMSRGVPNMLLTGLAQTRGLDIVSGQRLHEVVRQTGLDSLETLDQSQIAEVARRAGAGAVVVGTIVKAGSEIRIDAKLEDLSSGRVLVADSVRGTDLFALVDQLAVRIRGGVGFHDADSVRHVADVSTPSLDAYRAYSDGLTAYNNTRGLDARDLFKQAVAVDPAFAQAYFHLSLVSGQLGLTTDSQIYASKASEHADRLSERQKLLLSAELARHAGNYEEAVRVLEDVIAKYPDTEEAYAVACRIYDLVTGVLNDPRRHLAIIEAGVTALPASTLLRNFYGYAQLEEGRYAEAVRTFESYARLAPREPNPHDSLGEAHLLMGLPEKALEHYSRALIIDETFVPSRAGRAWTLAVLGRYDEALEVSQPYLFLRAFMLSRVGRYGEADRLIDADIRRAEANGNVSDQGLFHLVSSVLALERRQSGRAAEAVRAAERLFGTLPPGQQRAYSVLKDALAGLASLQAGQVDAARARLDAQRRIVNQNVAPELWWHKLLEGEIALAAGDAERAAAAFSAGEPRTKMWLHLSTQHLSLLANNLPSRDGAARAALKRGDTTAAIREYRQLLSPGQAQQWTAMYEPRYVLQIGRLLEQSGDRSGAMKEYERFLDFWKGADRNLPELAEALRAVGRSTN
jgi:tetratricopeptide (TPR) repeat protein/TolB-like protein